MSALAECEKGGMVVSWLRNGCDFAVGKKNGLVEIQLLIRCSAAATVGSCSATRYAPGSINVSERMACRCPHGLSSKKGESVWSFSFFCFMMSLVVMKAIANTRNRGEKAGVCRVWFNLASQLTDVDMQIMRFRIMAGSPHLGQ